MKQQLDPDTLQLKVMIQKEEQIVDANKEKLETIRNSFYFNPNYR